MQLGVYVCRAKRKPGLFFDKKVEEKNLSATCLTGNQKDLQR